MPDVRARSQAHSGAMLPTGSDHIDAQRAFTRVVRSRRRAAVSRSLRRSACGGHLRVIADDELAGRRPAARGGTREIPLEAITGTLEPSRAQTFDASFRPAPAARARWERLWLAEQRGQVLPPISVVPLRDGYAVRDGHHRVSVARARGALTIDASVEALPG
jgi:hypothetical protein